MNWAQAESPEVDGPASRRPRFRRVRSTVKWTGIAWAVFLVVWAPLALWDEAPLPVDDLRPIELEPVDDEDNAAIALKRAGELYRPPRRFELETLLEFFGTDERRRVLRESGLTVEWIVDYVELNRPCLEQVARAARCSGFRLSDGRASTADSEEVPSEVRTAPLVVAQLAGHLAIDRGRFDEAEEYARDLFAIARTTSGPRGEPGLFPWTSHVHRWACSVTRNLARASGVDARRLERLASELHSLGLSDDRYRSFLRRVVSWESKPRKPFRFKPGETHNRRVEAFRVALERFEFESFADASQKELSGWDRYFSGNAEGLDDLMWDGSSLRIYVREVRRTRNDLAATSVLIALRAYEIEQGALPNELSQLVPHYLASEVLDRLPGIVYRRDLRRLDVDDLYVPKDASYSLDRN